MSLAYLVLKLPKSYDLLFFTLVNVHCVTRLRADKKTERNSVTSIEHQVNRIQEIKL